MVYKNSNTIQFFLVFYLNDILIKSTGKHTSAAQLLYRQVLHTATFDFSYLTLLA